MAHNPTTLANLCKSYYNKVVSKTGKSGVLDIIEFTTNREVGLGFNLYPMQKLILKLFFNLPLSDKVEDNPIEIPDLFNEKVLFVLSEVEAVEYLHSERMLNLSYKDIKERSSLIVEILFFIGRRGSKTTMVSIIFAYIVYLLIKLQNPHLYFRVAYSDPIGLLVVSNNEDGAIRQFSSLKQILRQSKFIKPYLRKPKGQEYFIASPRFVELEKRGDTETLGDIKIVANASTAKVRGISNVAVGMDEYAHYRDSRVKNKQKPIDREIYEALLPSVSGFVNLDGTPFGRSFVYTSPNGKRGESWKKYNDSFNRKDVLMLRTPSHYVNRNVASQLIRKMYDESESSCRQEYWAEFIDIVGGFIKNVHRLKAQINTLFPNSINNGRIGGKYNLSVDMAQSGDGLVFVVTHKEGVRPKHIPPPPDDSYEGIEYSKYLAIKEIVVTDFYLKVTPEEKGGVISHGVILEIFRKIVNKFNIIKATIDQWNYQVYSELLVNGGIISEEVLELFIADDKSNDMIARTFNRIISEGRAMFPAPMEYDGGYDELISLSEIRKAKGYIKVEALGTLEHDDFYSALSRSMFMSEISEDMQNLIGSDMLSKKARDKNLVDTYKKELDKIKAIQSLKKDKMVKIKKFDWNKQR